ncbi:MAG: hypothetical protein K6F05_01460 [Succinivibrio sp.]|nr:hypothetical protein [Succinivibrio sp.]
MDDIKVIHFFVLLVSVQRQPLKPPAAVIATKRMMSLNGIVLTPFSRRDFFTVLQSERFGVLPQEKFNLPLPPE